MRLRIPEKVVFEIVDGEAVLLDLSAGTYYSLNASASRIWKLIEEHGELGKVKSVLAVEFNVDSDVLESDLTTVIDELQQKGLLEIQDGDASEENLSS